MDEYKILEMELDVLEMLMEDKNGKPLVVDLHGYLKQATTWKEGDKIKAKLVRKPPMETWFFDGEVKHGND